MAKSNSSKLKLTNSKKDHVNSDFQQFTATMRLPIAPVWTSTGTTQVGGTAGSGGMEGVREVLAGWVMRYLPPLQCVLLSFDPIPTLLHPTSTFSATASPFPTPSSIRSRDPARLLMSPGPEDESDEEEPAEGEEKKIALKGVPLIAGSGFGLAEIEWKGLGWRPRVGQKLVGSPTLSTPSHISLLLHNLFNASIPASHIPTDTYYFDSEYPVPASIQLRQLQSFPPIVPVVIQEEEEVSKDESEGDSEEESKAVAAVVGTVIEGEVGDAGGEEEEEKPVSESGMEMEIDEDEDVYRERGWWRHNVTHSPLGGEDGDIEFTVVGLTIANSMISITGSLLADPFSVKVPPKARAASISTKHNKRRRANSDSDSGSDSQSDSDEGNKKRAPSLSAPPRLGSVARSDVSGATGTSKKAPSISKEDRRAAKKAKKAGVQEKKRERGQTPVGDKQERRDNKAEKRSKKKLIKKDKDYKRKSEETGSTA